MFSKKWLPDSAKLWQPLGMIVMVLLFYVVLLPRALGAFVGLPFEAKLLVSAALLVPLGFIMGMPFPTGLRALAIFQKLHQQSNEGGVSEGPVEWAWALNAGASVLGSVTAILVAIQFGLNVTLLCGAAAYSLALLLGSTLPRYCVGNPVDCLV